MAAAELSAAGVKRPYRRRRPMPALIFLAVLGLVATIVWFQVIGNDGEADAANACAPPPSPLPAADGQPVPTLGQPLPDDSLDQTAPAPPGGSLLRVINASGARRLAGAVTEALRELGFTQVTDPTNDLIYTNGSLNCRAQIRFGQQGMPAARTLSLLEPCAELVRDERQDATVDLALGQRYTHLEPTPESRRIMEQLNNWAQNGPQGGLQNADGSGPALDPNLVAAAKTVRC